MSSDVERLRREVSFSDIAAQYGVKLERDGDEFVSCCPFHTEDTPSFTIFRGKDGVERMHCFGCDDAKGDVLDFVQKIKGVDLKEAIRILDGGASDRPNVKPRQVEVRDPYAGIVPFDPKSEIEPGKKVKLYNPKRAGTDRAWGSFAPSMVFPYRRLDGSLIGYVLRHDLPGGKKETPMVMAVTLPDGKKAWSRFPFPKPRTLYGLEALADYSGQVIVVEGEKCRDALMRASGRVVVSWAGGTQGVKHTDWSPLAGRSVVIWPDADAPGIATAQEIAAICHGIDCAVKIMDVLGARAA